MTTAAEAAVIALPAILAAAALVNPQIGVIAPVVLQLIDAATKLEGASLMTAEQLQALFADIGAGINSTHAQWAALNAGSAA